MSLAVIPQNGFWPHRWEIIGFGGWDATSGGTLYRGQSSTQITGGDSTNGVATADDGDTYSWYVPLDSGTWSILSINSKGNNRGRFDVTLGGVTVASLWDLYNSTLIANSVTVWTGITVSTPGVKVLKFTTNGKNASSADYAFDCYLLTGVRTGA